MSTDYKVTMHMSEHRSRSFPCANSDQKNQIPCSDYEKSYVGETGRPFTVRMKEPSMKVYTVTPDLSETGSSENLIYPTLCCESQSQSCVQSDLIYPTPAACMAYLTHFMRNKCGRINESPLCLHVKI